MGATLLLYKFTIDQPDTGMRPDSGRLQRTVGLHHLIYVSYIFLPQRTAYT